MIVPTFIFTLNGTPFLVAYRNCVDIFTTLLHVNENKTRQIKVCMFKGDFVYKLYGDLE